MSLTPVTIVTPCYNESVFAIRFLESLEASLAALPFAFCVVVVNDRSTDDTSALLRKFSFTSANLSLRVLDLKFNVGQQAAIYQGLLYAIISLLWTLMAKMHPPQSRNCCNIWMLIL